MEYKPSKSWMGVYCTHHSAMFQLTFLCGPPVSLLLTSIALCCGKALSMWSLPSARSWIRYLQPGCKKTLHPLSRLRCGVERRTRYSRKVTFERSSMLLTVRLLKCCWQCVLKRPSHYFIWRQDSGLQSVTVWMLNPRSWHTHQQTPESEATLLISDGVLAVEATLSLSHRLYGHIPLCIPTQRLHRSVAAEDRSSQDRDTDQTHVLWTFVELNPLLSSKR